VQLIEPFIESNLRRRESFKDKFSD